MDFAALREGRLESKTDHACGELARNRLAQAWAELRRDELIEDWNLLQRFGDWHGAPDQF